MPRIIILGLVILKAVGVILRLILGDLGVTPRCSPTKPGRHHCRALPSGPSTTRRTRNSTSGEDFLIYLLRYSIGIRLGESGESAFIILKIMSHGSISTSSATCH
jgi:hypothetical protein